MLNDCHISIFCTQVYYIIILGRMHLDEENIPFAFSTLA